MPRLLKIHMWPVWFLALFTQGKSFKANPLIGSRFLNILGLHIKRVIAARCAAHIRWALLSRTMPKDMRKAFQRDGFVAVPDFISKDQIAAIKAELAAYQGEARQMIQGDTATQRILLDGKALDGCPRLAALAEDRTFLGLLAYGGAKAVRPILYVQRIRNGFQSGKADPQKTMHADTFHPTMKAWLFLEDVRAEDGPFTYVRGSSRLTWKRLKWEYERSKVAGALKDGYSEKGSFRAGPEDLVAMDLPSPEGLTATAGTLVIANTVGFHGRGQAEAGANRIEVWAYSRHNPFSPLPGFGFRWRTRLEHRVMQAFWRHKDKVAARKNSRASWHLISADTMLGDMREPPRQETDANLS